MEDGYDVVVVGGGVAGLSAACVLARSRRSVLVVDAGEPRNATAAHVHNLLGHEGVAPADLLAAGVAEVVGYGGRVVSGRVVSVRQLRPEPPGGARFAVRLHDGRTPRARRLLVATGLVDELPDVPGLAQRWGRDVLHCPYCHGWEIRGRSIGVLGTGSACIGQALMLREWSDDVVLFRHTAPAPGSEERDRLAARGITVVDGRVCAVETAGSGLTVRLSVGRVVARHVLAVMPRFHARAEVLAQLGVEAVPWEIDGQVTGSYIPADPDGATTVPGVWVAGNVTDVRSRLVLAAASGVHVGMVINDDLVEEGIRHDVARYRQRSFTSD